MYSRSYYPESPERLSLPENYDGTAFMERNDAEIEDAVEEVSFNEASNTEAKQSAEQTGGRAFSGLGNMPLFSGLFDKGGLLGGLGLKWPHIGTEEILILATAAFLFFSKSGDRECALILLLLLFIN